MANHLVPLLTPNVTTLNEEPEVHCTTKTKASGCMLEVALHSRKKNYKENNLLAGQKNLVS
jgi:hypothetical protein